VASMPPDWWAKFDRGQEHLNNLTQFIEETLKNENNMPILGVKFDADTQEHVLYVKETPDLSQFCSRVGLIFGDCLNNFRNALDYLVYEMGIKHTKSKGGLKHPDRIKFPIVDKLENWKSIRGKELAEVSSEQQDAIEIFQPFHKRDLQTNLPNGQAPYVPLALLRDLTDYDKHRLLIPIVVRHGNTIIMGEIAVAMMNSGRCKTMHGNDDGIPIECSSEIWRAKLLDGRPQGEGQWAGRIEALAVRIQPQRYQIERVVNTIAHSVRMIISDLESAL
jgi:hypothetical protein